MNKKVSISEIKKTMDTNTNNIVKIFFKANNSDKGFEANFKTTLPLTQEFLLIELAVQGTFINDNYKPEYQHISFVNAILSTMSNITLPKIDNGNVNLSILADWDNCFDFVGTLYENSRICTYIHYLEDVVNKKIEYIKEQNLRKSKLDELYDEIKVQINKFGNKFDRIDMKQFAEDLHKIASMIGNVDNKTIVDEIIKLSNKVKKDNVVNIKDVK